MDVRIYTKKLLTQVQGVLPVKVLVWVIIFVLAVLSTVTLVSMQYYSLYTHIQRQSEPTQVNAVRTIIDGKKLDEVVGVYGGL